MLISPLQKYEPKTWTGLTTENHLGAMFAEEPQFISKVIEQIYKVNLGGDDIVSFLDQFPVEYVEEDVPFKWMLQGADETNYALVGAYADYDESALPAKPGLGISSFVMVFPEKQFFATDVIVGEKPDLYKLRVIEDPQRLGTNWAYKVELVTGMTYYQFLQTKLLLAHVGVRNTH